MLQTKTFESNTSNIVRLCSSATSHALYFYHEEQNGKVMTTEQ